MQTGPFSFGWGVYIGASDVVTKFIRRLICKVEMSMALSEQDRAGRRPPISQA